MNIRNNEYKEAESMNSVSKVLFFVEQPCKYTTASYNGIIYKIIYLYEKEPCWYSVYFPFKLNF